MLMMNVVFAALFMILAFAPPASALQVTLTWVDQTEPDPANEETGFLVERRDGVDANPWIAQTTTAANVTTFNQTGLTLGTRYCYRQIAINAFASAAPSTPMCGTPDLPLPASGGTMIFAP